MVADDTYYITPHEAALAVIATAMKKARLQITTLTLNSLLGGVLFSSGSIMAVAAHSENYGLMRENPGFADSYSGVLFGIGLFYVVIMGADLFNSNILFFSVGLLRRAVSIYDLLVSWSVSLIGNLASSIFVSYLFCHISKVTSTESWKAGSRELVESKASFSFMETFLKGIAGNFFVCLAIYLQLMAKPLHVRLILVVLPIFTFVSCGFSHVVADMVVSFIGMLNGANVSVGKYIWKLLIPDAVGNIIGGFAFSLVVPFYLHLVVVESDREKLSLPEYDARDEQPELNTDSRVVRVSPAQNEDELENELDESESFGKRELDEADGSVDNSSLSSRRSSNESPTREYTPSDYVPVVSRVATNRSTRSIGSRRSSRSLHPFSARSPPGVFPVKGMGEPLRRERTIQNPYSVAHEVFSHETNEEKRKHRKDTVLGRRINSQGSQLSSYVFNPHDTHRLPKRPTSDYNVVDDRPGAKLERAITKIMEPSQRAKSVNVLPRTTQETFPHNRPGPTPSPSDTLGEMLTHRRTSKLGAFLTPKRNSMASSDASSIERSLRRAGITHNAAAAANAVAGVANFDDLDFQESQSSKRFHSSQHNSYLQPGNDQLQSSDERPNLQKSNSVSLGLLQGDSDPSDHLPK